MVNVLILVSHLPFFQQQVNVLTLLINQKRKLNDQLLEPPSWSFLIIDKILFPLYISININLKEDIMLKKKIKIISLIVLLLISLLTPIVNAENEVKVETTTTDQVNPISETQETVTIKEGDEYLFQDTVTVDTPVDGNLFIIANTVTINSQIGGDAFIFANTINIEENGYILSNLFACANAINVKGVAYNIYSIT